MIIGVLLMLFGGVHKTTLEKTSLRGKFGSHVIILTFESDVLKVGIAHSTDTEVGKRSGNEVLVDLF